MESISAQEMAQKLKSGEWRFCPPKELPEELLPRIKALWESVGQDARSDLATLEDWEKGFMTDTNPEKEVEIWERIAKEVEGKQFQSRFARRRAIFQLVKGTFQTTPDGRFVVQRRTEP